MGLFDSLGKIVSTVDRTTQGVEHGINTAERAKRVGDRVGGAGGAFQKKCKFCEKPLSSNDEKKAGVCTECALERLGQETAKCRFCGKEITSAAEVDKKTCAQCALKAMSRK